MNRIIYNLQLLRIDNWKKILTILLLSLVLSQSVANPGVAAEQPATPATLGIGAAFAPIAGHGFSFRKLPEKGFGFQCGTIFWKTGSESFFNFGAEILYVLKHTRLTAFYVPAGIGYSYRNVLQYRYFGTPDLTQTEYREKTTNIFAGAGLGFTARTESWEDIWFSLDLVMVANKEDILPLPQFAIHYYFR